MLTTATFLNSWCLNQLGKQRHFRLRQHVAVLAKPTLVVPHPTIWSGGVSFYLWSKRALAWIIEIESIATYFVLWVTVVLIGIDTEGIGSNTENRIG